MRVDFVLRSWLFDSVLLDNNLFYLRWRSAGFGFLFLGLYQLSPDSSLDSQGGFKEERSVINPSSGLRFFGVDIELIELFWILTGWSERALTQGFGDNASGNLLVFQAFDYGLSWALIQGRDSGYLGSGSYGMEISSPFVAPTLSVSTDWSFEPDYKYFPWSVLIPHSVFFQQAFLLSFFCVPFECDYRGCSFSCFGCLSRCFLPLRVMSQSALLLQGAKGSSSGSGGKLKIKVPQFDNTALIEGYAKTLIGRCMNPVMQDMKALLFMLPRIWKMEERVIGADLGLGRFQFDFDHEDDIQEVQKMEPYHFYHWMLSLVRWEPVVDPRYPYHIKFWVRVMGVPLHSWADETFRTIGADLGEVEEVDLDNGRVKILLDGFKPLIFDATIEFHSGEETTISLRYERLFGYCRRCYSLCHDISRCPLFGDKGKQRLEDNSEPRPEDKLQSYKGAMVNGLPSGNASGLGGANLGVPHQGSASGNGRGAGSQAVNHRAAQGFGGKWWKNKRGAQADERFVKKKTPMVSGPVSTSQVPISGNDQVQSGTSDVRHNFTAEEQKMLDDFLGPSLEETVATGAPSVESMSVLAQGADKRVCKTLFPADASVTVSGSLALSQQEVLFSDDLSNLLGQEFPTKEDHTLSFMDTIMEEQGLASGDISQEDSLLTDEQVAEESTIEGDLSDQAVMETVSDVVEGVSEDKSQGEEIGGTIHPSRAKVVKQKGALPGASTKKRNLFSLTSPRKKAVAKGVGLNGKLGSHQGGKPPNPAVD